MLDVGDVGRRLQDPVLVLVLAVELCANVLAVIGGVMIICAIGGFVYSKYIRKSSKPVGDPLCAPLERDMKQQK